MATVCWAHAVGIEVVLKTGPGIPDPLGSCFECGRFGCAGHAEMDQGKGKWICFPSVASAIAASAGLGVPMETLHLASSEEFEERFPLLATATKDLRSAAYGDLARRGAAPGVTDTLLLADAVGVGRALAPVEGRHLLLTTQATSRGEVTSAEEPLRLLFAGPFGQLLSDLEH